MEPGAPKPAEDDQAPASAAPTVVVRMSHAGSGGSSTSRMITRVQHSSTVSFEGDDAPNSGSRGDDDSGNAAFTSSNSDNSQSRRLSVTVSRQNSMGSSTGPQGKRGYSTRVKKPRPLSGSSAAGSSVFDGRASMISRMSSTVGLRDTFFGGRREDPLELSTSQEFDLTVIDESGGMEENIVGQILTPDVSGWSSWSVEGWIVVAIGVATVVITASLAVAMPTLDGYTIDPGLVFGSLQTLILCAIVFITYHGVQSFQAHPNPLILYKCVIDMVLALRFLLDPLLQDWGVYTPGERNSCNYLSGVTQFLYLSSDSWYFALIVDLYTSLTNPFTSVKADRKKYKIAIYSIAAFMGFMTAVVKGAHGFSDGTYCWTNRGSSHERNFFKLNVASWLVFYDWMILYYIAGIAVLIFCAKRLRSGLRDTLQTRRDMLRNGAISIMSFTGYWTIVFMWYAVSFHTRTAYRADGTLGPSKIFRSFAYTLSGRGAVDYFVWFMLNRPSLMRKNWLKFSSESADKKFSAQLNTALQHELIYFTIEGMTRAIQMADDELIFSRDRSPTRDLVESSEIFRDRESSNPPILGGGEHGRQHHSEINTGNLQESPVGSSHTSSDRKKNSKKKQLVKGDSGTFDIPRVVPPKKKDPRASPATLSPAGIGVGGASPHRKASTNSSYNHIRFTPYKPDEFAELRSAYGISASDFQKSFETSTKPNISEGASGAFMFFSGDRKFIVKSMSESECRFLCEIAENYVEFLIANPSSLITKFYGCFKITLYEKKFYFIVMENLFDVAEQGVQIHHRFDIKGSWVNRSYKRPRRGAKVKCRHCSMQFKYGAKKTSLQCPNVVGLHEPNVVLKDNDLRTRMRIGREAGRELYELLCEDSLFLCRLGIMDYSLLLGVVDIEFMVDQPKANSRRNTVTSANADGANQSFMTTMSSSSFVEDVAGDVVQGAKAALQSLAHEPAAPRDRNDSELHNGPSVRSLTHMDPNGNPLGHSHSRSKKSMRRSKRIFGPGYYYIGVIDILQTWTLKKRLERFWKVNFQRCDAEGLSAIEPEQYQRRFEAKLREIIALPKDYQAALNQRRKTHSVGGFNFVSASSRGARGVQSTRGSVEAPGGAAMRTSSSHEIAYDDDEVDIDVLVESGGRSGRGAGTRGRSAGRMTIEEVDTSDSQTNSSSSAIDDSEDVEQAQRNPEPILLHFSQMLVGSSTRSNITNVSFQRDAVQNTSSKLAPTSSLLQDHSTSRRFRGLRGWEHVRPMVLQQYHEHHNINHSSKDVNSDMDAIPILSARGDEPPLLYQHDHERDPDPTDVVHLYPPRRKRHSGNSESINSSVARFVRRRGRSVPCDTSAGITSYSANDGNGNGNSSNGYGDDAEFPQVERRRAGSAGSALAGSRAAAARANGGDLHGELPRRRRAGSSILNHFRRRHKEHAQGQNQNAYESQQQVAVRRRKVHFKTTLHAEVMPNPYAQLPTYDELLFNVGGLYQTLSFLHDPMPSEDPAMTNSTGSSTDSNNSQHGLDDDLAHPPERSMQLMIAEFLYRSAVYLGYPNDSKPWIPGFRETKRFSVNDVKRWRRLAHHDWEKEEQQFQKSHEFPHGNGHRKIGIRATVSGWLHRRRRHSAPAKLAISCPPPVSPNADLSLLVTIANSCVYCGAFQFDARDIRALCNVEI